MKKLLLLTLLITFSCDKKDVNCTCNLRVAIVDPNLGQIGNYTVTNVPEDCDGNYDVTPLNLPPNHWVQSCD